MTVVINKALTKKERDAILEKLKSEPSVLMQKSTLEKSRLKEIH